MEVICYQNHNVVVDDGEMSILALQEYLAKIYGVDAQQIGLLFGGVSVPGHHKVSYYFGSMHCRIKKRFTLIDMDQVSSNIIYDNYKSSGCKDFVEKFGKTLCAYQCLLCDDKIVTEAKFNMEFDNNKVFRIGIDPRAVNVPISVELCNGVSIKTFQYSMDCKFDIGKVIPKLYSKLKYECEGCTLDGDLSDKYEDVIVRICEPMEGYLYVERPDGDYIREFNLSQVCHFDASYGGQSVRGKVFGDFSLGARYIKFDKCNEGYQIFINATGGTCYSFALEVECDDYISTIKEKVASKAGMHPNIQRIIFAAKQLKDDRTLFDYNIWRESTLNVIPNLRGGGGPVFSDVSNKKAYQEHEWSSDAPDWRIAKNGLCIEGKCTNSECVAKGKNVIVNMGYVCADIAVEELKCPMCFHMVIGTTCGFNNGFYKIIGQKNEGENIDTPWCHVGDHYKRCEEQIAGMVKWDRLVLIARETDPDNECALCLENMNYVNVCGVGECGHNFHKECITTWLNKSKTCPLCRVEVGVKIDV